MKIYKYYINNEWDNFINTLPSEWKKREEAINEWIVKNGKEVSLEEYFKDYNRESFYKEYRYEHFGEIKNIFEQLAAAEMSYDDELYYCEMKKNSPEDLIESRTDWDTLKEYADGMSYFIERVKNEFADGHIKIVENEC